MQHEYKPIGLGVAVVSCILIFESLPGAQHRFTGHQNGEIGGLDMCVCESIKTNIMGWPFYGQCKES